MRYDVAVIGAGIAGLATAALLTRSGKRIIVLDPRSSAGGRLSEHVEGSMRFPAFPPLVQGFEPAGPFQVLYASLGIPVPASTGSDASAYQVVLPDRRVTISSGIQASINELDREFPRERDRIARMLHHAKLLADRAARSALSAYLNRRRSAAEFLRRYGLSGEFTSFLDAQARYFHGAPANRLSVAELATMINTPPVRIEGGWQGFAAKIADMISRQGGVCRFQEPWPEMQFRSNRIIGLVTLQGAIEADTVVLNAAITGQVKASSLGIRKRGVPVGMRDTVLVLDDYDRPDDIAVITVASMADQGMSPDGLAAVTASSVDSFGIDDHGRPLQERVASIMPFLSEFTVFSGERDLSSELVSLPEQVRIRHGGKDQRVRLPMRTSIRNLLVIPDTVPAAHQIEAALKLARKLV